MFDKLKGRLITLKTIEVFTMMIILCYRSVIFHYQRRREVKRWVSSEIYGEVLITNKLIKFHSILTFELFIFSLLSPRLCWLLSHYSVYLIWLIGCQEWELTFLPFRMLLISCHSVMYRLEVIAQSHNTHIEFSNSVTAHMVIELKA